MRSIMLPPIGPAVAQLPALSQTVRASVSALAVSAPPTTDVISVNDPSDELARPLNASTAWQESVTLSPCHRPSAASHVICGGAESSDGFAPLVPASMHC